MDDHELVAKLGRRDPSAEDWMTSRLREALERVASTVATAESHDEVAVSALYEILQAEGRVLAGWDGRAPFVAYLTVVAARVCLHEGDRWSVLEASERPGLTEQPRRHLGDADLAAYVAGEADERLAGDVLRHLDQCRRCARVVEAARAALAGE